MNTFTFDTSKLSYSTLQELLKVLNQNVQCCDGTSYTVTKYSIEARLEDDEYDYIIDKIINA